MKKSDWKPSARPTPWRRTAIAIRALIWRGKIRRHQPPRAGRPRWKSPAMCSAPPTAPTTTARSRRSTCSRTANTQRGGGLSVLVELVWLAALVELLQRHRPRHLETRPRAEPEQGAGLPVALFLEVITQNGRAELLLRPVLEMGAPKFSGSSMFSVESNTHWNRRKPEKGLQTCGVGAKSQRSSR